MNAIFRFAVVFDQDYEQLGCILRRQIYFFGAGIDGLIEMIKA